MSGFDLIVCEMPLPDANFELGKRFQTRAFDGVFEDIYRITAEGYLLGPYEQGFSKTAGGDQDEPGCKLREQSPGKRCRIAMNGDIEFWSQGPSSQTFFACFVEGRCIQILPEHDYRALMEQGRRWALFRLLTAPLWADFCSGKKRI